jgi:hypothetical protein
MTGPGGVFAKVKEKPWWKERGHNIQHDGAKPHAGGGNQAHFDEQGVVDGWKIKCIKQPAQSPDLNVLLRLSASSRCGHQDACLQS